VCLAPDFQQSQLAHVADPCLLDTPKRFQFTFAGKQSIFMLSYLPCNTSLCPNTPNTPT